LEGVAFFDVTKSSTNFIVNTLLNSSIVVKGTQFLVNADSQNHIVETSLVEGDIEFRFKGLDKKTHIIDMNPDDKIVYNSDLLSYTKSKIQEPLEYLTTGEYKFNNVPLREVFDVVSLIHNVKFSRSSEIDSIHYTGVIRGSYDADKTIQLITKTTRLKYKYDSKNEVTIHK